MLCRKEGQREHKTLETRRRHSRTLQRKPMWHGGTKVGFGLEIQHIWLRDTTHLYEGENQTRTTDTRDTFILKVNEYRPRFPQQGSSCLQWSFSWHCDWWQCFFSIWLELPSLEPIMDLVGWHTKKTSSMLRNGDALIKLINSKDNVAPLHFLVPWWSQNIHRASGAKIHLKNNMMILPDGITSYMKVDSFIWTLQLNKRKLVMLPVMHVLI